MLVDVWASDAKQQDNEDKSLESARNNKLLSTKHDGNGEFPPVASTQILPSGSCDGSKYKSGRHRSGLHVPIPHALPGKGVGQDSAGFRSTDVEHEQGNVEAGDEEEQGCTITPDDGPVSVIEKCGRCSNR